MDILRDDQAPVPPEVESWRETAWDHLVFGLFMSALAIVAVALPFLSAEPLGTVVISICALVALALAAIGRFALRAFFASRDPRHWLVRWSPEGLALRFRSYHNRGFPADTPTTVFWPHKEIDWIRRRAKMLDMPDPEGGWSIHKRVSGIELGLKNVDTAPLAAALQAEAKRRTAKRSRVNHYPVTIGDDGTVRVEMRRPAPLLQKLARAYPVIAGVTEPPKRFADMTKTEKDAHIRELARAGETIAAVKATREAYGCGLTEAKQRVDTMVTG